MIRNDVEQHAEPGFPRRPAERPERVLAAEIVRDPGRIDDVAAVGRTRARLQRGREIEVRDAEVTQIRDQPTRFAEAEPRPEPEPVRAAKGGR